ncbi:acyclic terpene utilization AtuA family protein [Mycolicibacterium llatzerense]|uniref:acyclic terpene utilization AtuA family protein n=1 Tax=Mycolicibacterium llatzerense TaxID=280871 RepID=UPI0008DE65D9|nr:acyclic terpene utilization AtuA family protein [Mycolicibacterium llatzerense]
MSLLAENPDLIRIGNCSGFYGDRFSAVREMLEGGQLDVLTGDYLAELTMLILARDKMKDPSTGYAKTFVRQMEDSLGLALDKGVQIVVNAGGVNPAGLAVRLREVAEKLGLDVKIAHVEGDDITSRADELGLGSPLAANAYLGAWGIVECLNAGADVVVTGRVTDASVIVGPAAAHFGWDRTDYDQIAGAMVAGHIIECSAQATGGNYSLFTEVDLNRPGFPIAEIRRDGSSVITKHEGTGGAVTVDTVNSQLMYEIQGARYAGPDATARIDSIELRQDGKDRVLVSDVVGEAPPPQLKVSLNSLGGFRNEMEFVLTGLNIEEKAELVQRQLESWLTVRPATLDWTLARLDRPNAETQEQASALLRCVVRDRDPKKVGRGFTSVAIELALASYPGFHPTSPPGDGAPYGVFTAGYVDATLVPHVAVLPDGTRVDVKPAADTRVLADVPAPELPEPLPSSEFREVPLGTLALARSGDKGGNANIGVWVRTDDEWRWLVHALTTDELRRLLPEAASLPITRTVLPRLRAVNFIIEGLLGEGVAYNARFDPQAKGLAEWLRSRHIEIPVTLLNEENTR